MKKVITVTGVNGTFAGTVEIKFNYRTDIKEVHNRSTHDEEERKFSYNIVIGTVDGQQFKSEEFINENFIWQHIKTVESKVTATLRKLADEPKEKTLVEQLKDKGYA